MSKETELERYKRMVVWYFMQLSEARRGLRELASTRRISAEQRRFIAESTLKLCDHFAKQGLQADGDSQDE